MLAAAAEAAVVREAATAEGAADRSSTRCSGPTLRCCCRRRSRRRRLGRFPHQGLVPPFGSCTPLDVGVGTGAGWLDEDAGC